MRRVRHEIARGWQAALFWTVARAPWFIRAIKPLIVVGSWTSSGYIRSGTIANARYLLGTSSSPAAQRRLGRAVLSNCVEAVIEFGRNRRLTTAQILSQLESVSGEERYAEVRRQGQGAILVTAHLGPFESAMAMLKQREPRVHVVFRRDGFALFERVRAQQHSRLGVLDAPVDDGLPTWFSLRNALLANEVVLMQGDRVMEGQPGIAVPFLGGSMRVPSGPVKLARITGSPIVPTFAVRTAQHRTRIALEEPIWPDEFPPHGHSIDPALLRLTSVIERYVRDYPEQWLCLHAAWCHDACAKPSALLAGGSL